MQNQVNEDSMRFQFYPSTSSSLFILTNRTASFLYSRSLLEGKEVSFVFLANALSRVAVILM